MTVYLNNEILTLGAEKATLTSLLLEKNLQDKEGIAIALNMQVIPRTKWGETLLNPEDKIIIIKATQGG